jgi:hypothetical protein
MAFLGAAPFGNLLASALADRLGASTAVGLTGAACLAGSIWLALLLQKVTAAMRPVYAEKGLLEVRKR